MYKLSGRIYRRCYLRHSLRRCRSNRQSLWFRKKIQMILKCYNLSGRSLDYIYRRLYHRIHQRKCMSIRPDEILQNNFLILQYKLGQDKMMGFLLPSS